MHSAVAHGWVSHSRFEPKEHTFRYRQSMLLLDLDEAPELLAKHWFWSWNKPNLACVLRRDHLRNDEPDLAEAVRAEIERSHNIRPTGPISLLTMPRYWGYCLNPISFYFVWSADRQHLEWVLLEVHNTPWNEQHPYVLQVPEGSTQPLDLRFAKAMHVSPFMPMEMEYRLRLNLKPGQQLQVNLENYREQHAVFAARMNLSFRPVNSRSLLGLLTRTPFMSLKVAAAIYYQALRIKLKGVPYVPYPGPSGKPNSPNPSGVTP